MAIAYFSDEIISETKKKNYSLKLIRENAENSINSNTFLKFLLNDFLDFNLIKNKSFKLSNKTFNFIEKI
jgi:hypothetical protein